MKLDVTTLEGKASGSVDLNDEIFGLDPRADLLARCVRWQLAKRQAGTHAVKNRSAIDRTTKKVYKHAFMELTAAGKAQPCSNNGSATFIGIA